LSGDSDALVAFSVTYYISMAKYVLIEEVFDDKKFVKKLF
jgi:hypothetical protein